MEKEKFCCQICQFTFTRIFDFKKHLKSSVHSQRFAKVYPNDDVKASRHCKLPQIVFKDINVQHRLTQPILGLSQITLCFSPEVLNAFYLCHVCEQQCPLHLILSHIYHGDHYSNYFGYTDPQVLKFAWMPSMKSKDALMPSIKKEMEKTGVGELQVLHLTGKPQNECLNKTYSEVMTLLHENEMLSKTFSDVKSNRTSLQIYKEDLNRKHPLLGLQHIVECICLGQYERRHYLCSLCNIHVASSMVIKHVLSFDHIFCYFNIWHPSTLMAKECYLNYNIPFTSKMIDFAMQSQAIYGTADLQQVKLEPAEFALVFNAGYTEAMHKLESITKKERKCSLIPIVKAGKKLEPTTAAYSNSTSANKEESKPEPTSANSSVIQNVKPESKPGEPTSGPSPVPSYSLQCQVCTRTFETDTLYLNHFSMGGHQLGFKKIFGPASDEPVSQWKPHLPFYTELNKNVMKKQPIVGVSLVVTILSRQHKNDEPIYVCFACEACILKNVTYHLKSQRHFIQTLLYYNPWRLPFGWKKLDYISLKTQACEEEMERGSDKKIRILDVPANLFTSLFPPIFTKVMEKLGRCHTQLMNGIPRRETYSKLNENERFPLLGRDFLVKYNQAATGWKFLCLLCKRVLFADEYNAHVFSWEHACAFLESHHPGSLDLNTVDEEILLDLAKQAARIHRVSSEQEILFDRHIYEASDYSRKVHLLTAEKARIGKGNLVPCITPKMKLVPRQTRTEARGDSPIDSSASKDDEDQKCTAKNNTTVLENLVAEGRNDKLCTDQENAKSSEIILEETCSQENQAAKEEVTVQPTDLATLSPIKKVNENENRSTSNGGSDCESMDTTRKRPWGMCEKDHSSNETAAGELELKRRRLSVPDKTVETPSLNMNKVRPCSSGDKPVTNKVPSPRPEQQKTLWVYIQKKFRDPLIGLSCLYECFCGEHAPVYLCECCCQILKENQIVKHLKDYLHYKMYLRSVVRHPLPVGKKWRVKIRKMAADWEKIHGYGEAQVVDLTISDFSKLTEDFGWYNAITIVRAHLATEMNKSNICSTSPFLDGNHVVTSDAASGQQEMHQVVKKDTSSDPQLFSEPAAEKTETTFKTKVKSISSEDLTSVQRPEDGDKTDTCVTAAEPMSSHTTVTHPAISPTITTFAGISQSAYTPSSGTTVIPEVVAETPSIALDTSIEMEDPTFSSCITATDTHKPSKPVCKIIAAGSDVIKEPNTGTTNATPASSSDKCSKIASDSFPTSLCNTLASNYPFITTTKTTTDSSKLTGSTSITSVAFSNSTKNASKSQDGNAVAGPKLKLMLHKATSTPQANSTIICEATCKASPSCHDERSSKKITTISSSQTTETSTASVKPSGKGESPDSSTKSPEINNPSEFNVKRAQHPPASHHLPTPKTTSCEPNTQTTEPSPNNMPSECPQVGLDQLIKVKCKESKHYYCLACLVRLDGSSHLISTTHQMNSVKMKYPLWTGKPSESTLNEMVALLADDERALRSECKSIEVAIETYKELKALPGDKAIEKLKGIVKLKSSKNPVQRQPSVSTSEVSTSPCVSVSPYDVTSPDFGQDNSETKPQENSRVIAVPVKMSGSVESTVSSSIPDQKPTSTQLVPRIIKGVTTEDLSHLSRYLKVKGLDEPIIGLGFVWECRVVPSKPLKTFYLCESCRQTLSFCEIFKHVASTEHQMKYIVRQYPKFMYWIDEDLLPEMKESLTKDIAGMVTYREKSVDAQGILLSDECYEWVQTAPFVEALKVVQKIKEKKNPFLLLPINTSHHNDVKEKNKTSNSKEAGRKRDSVDAKQRPSPLDVNAASSNADMSSCASPEDSNKTLSSQVSVKLILEPQRSASQNSPKQLDVPSCSTVGLNTKQELSESSKGQIQPAQKVSNPCSDIHNDKDLLPDKSPPEPGHQSSLASTVVSPPVNIAVTPSSSDELPIDSVITSRPHHTRQFNSGYQIQDERFVKTSFQVSQGISTTDATTGPRKPLCSKDTDTAPVDFNSKSCASTTVSPNTNKLSDKYQSLGQAAEMPIKSNSNIPTDDGQLREKCLSKTSSELSHESAEVSTWVNASPVCHKNTDEGTAPDVQDKSQMDLHHIKLLIDLVKETKSKLNMSVNSFHSFTSLSDKSCTVNSSEGDVKICQSPKATKWDVQNPLKTATAEAPSDESISTGDQTTTPNVNAVLSGINLSSEDKLSIGNGVSIVNTEAPFIVRNTAVNSELKAQGNHTVKSISQNINNIQLSQDQLLKLQGEAPQMLSNIQVPYLQSQISQTLSKTSVQQSLDQGPQLQANNQVSHTHSQLQQDQVQQVQSNIWVAQTQRQVQQSLYQVSQTQGQISQLQSQIQVAPSQGPRQQLQGQMQQGTHDSDELPISSVITSRPCHTRQFNSGYQIQDERFVKTSFQVSQGISTTDATTGPSNTLTVAGGYSPLVQTLYGLNENLNSNNASQYIASQGSAFPSQVYHQVQSQQFYTPMQSFGQSQQPPEAPTWFNPGTQPQSVPQPYSAWTNTAVTSGGSFENSNFPYLYVPFNTPANYSYDNDYSRVQEYNSVLMQNSFFTQSTSPAPPSMNYQFFPKK